MSDDPRLHYPASQRNREPILGVLREALPPTGLVLEIASGSGQHTAFFAPLFGDLTWQPSDPDPACRASIDAWNADHDNVRGAVILDVHDAEWPVATASAVLCINMIHISPWSATLGLLDGAARLLAPGGLLYLYGPYRIDGRHTAPSNEAFDASLRARDPAWGVRDLTEIAAEDEARGLDLERRVAMPANNFSVLFRRR